MNEGRTNAKSQDTNYRFDPLEAETIAPMIDRAFSGGDGCLGAQPILEREIAEYFLSCAAGSDSGDERVSNEDGPRPRRPIAHEIDRVLFYELQVPHRGPVTCDLVPVQNEDDHSWPPLPADVSSDVAELWRHLASLVHAPAARARLHDLKFVRGVDRFASAVAARDAYLEFAAAKEVFDLDEAYSLLRAWTLDRKFRREDAEAESRSALHRAIEASWDSGGVAPGVLLPMLGALCRTPLRKEGEDHVPVDRLLLRASDLYRMPESVEYIGDLRRGRAKNDEERLAINEWQVTCLAEVARKSEGLIKALRLKEAIATAKRFHLASFVATLTRELQALPAGDVQLQTIASEVPVSRIPIEGYMRQFTSDRDWRIALLRFSRTSVPTGRVVDLENSRRERLERPRIMDLVHNVLLDEDRLPQWEPTTDEERHGYMLAREATWTAAFHGHILADILDRIGKRYGPIPETELTAFLAYEGRGNAELAAVLSRSLSHYWRGDMEAAAYIAVPRIEAAVRLILKEFDVAIYQTQIGERPGMYPQLANMISLLPEIDMDEDWIYFLEWFLVSHAGKNFRNQIAHGRVRSISPSDAALSIRALMLVTALAGPGQTDDDILESHPDFRGWTRSVGERDPRAAVSRITKVNVLDFPARWKVALHLAIARLADSIRRV